VSTKAKKKDYEAKGRTVKIGMITRKQTSGKANRLKSSDMEEKDTKRESEKVR